MTLKCDVSYFVKPCIAQTFRHRLSRERLGSTPR